MALTISVVIPTYRRPQDLAACLDSILGQSVMPLEVIVVDNEAAQSTQTLVRQYEAKYSECQITLRYLANKKNSLPFARNLGVKSSSGEIVLFLDDDFILESGYLDEIIRMYEGKPGVLGVQGYVGGDASRSYRMRALFFLPRPEEGKCRVMPSIYTTYPLNLEEPIPCEYLSGCNASFRRLILTEFAFDENLLKYSFGEDLDLSYRISQCYPKSLWITPFARGIHKVSPAGRSADKEAATLSEVYRLYIFYKLFSTKARNKVIYIWSTLGQILGKLTSPSPVALLEIKHLLEALILCLRHLNDIRRGDLGFFNNTLSEMAVPHAEAIQAPIENCDTCHIHRVKYPKGE
jgi:glycosyltransferase involved in cell wall biosynthesis